MEQLIAPQKYINPMIDVAFKYLFGTEKNKHLLKPGSLPPYMERKKASISACLLVHS
jgi:hypothetical protein